MIFLGSNVETMDLVSLAQKQVGGSADRIAMLGIGLFKNPTGISRAVQTLVDYFGDRAIVVTDDVQALKGHEIGRAHVYKVKASRHHPWLRPIVSYAPTLVALHRIFRREKVSRICVNTVPQLVKLSLVLSTIKILSRKTRTTVVVYDYEELRWTPRRLPMKLMMKLLAVSGIVTDFVVLNDKMKILLERSVKHRPVYVVRLGVASTILTLAESPMESITAKVRPELLQLVRKDRERVKVLFVGILIPRRRLEDLLEALSLVKQRGKDVVLYVASLTGENEDYVARLKTQAEILSVANVVRFLKTFAQEELAYLYRSCDIFVFPAVQQSWGLAPLEAMAFEMPVIVSRGSGVSEILEGRNVAVIVPPYDPEKLAESIESLATDEQRRLSLAKSGSTFVRKDLTYYQTGLVLDQIWSKKTSVS